MPKYTKMIAKNFLFQNMSAREISYAMSFCLIKKHIYKKGSFIDCDNEKLSHSSFFPKKLYILQEGCVQLIVDDDSGNRLLGQSHRAGDIFVGTFFDVNAEKTLVGYLAIKKTIAVSVSFENINKLKRLSNKIYVKMLHNLCLFFADSRINLYKRLECIGKTCVREKIKSYLLDQKYNAGKNKFMLPISKNDMASYLFINRSAMTRELAAMKKEKLIDFKGREFTLLFQ